MDSLLKEYIEKHLSDEPELLRELFHETNACVYNGQMCSGFYQGHALQMVCNMIKPQRILEIGTFTGYSAICMAQVLPENGKLITIENNDELEEMIRRYFKKSSFENKIQLIISSALEVIPKLTDTFDLVFMDADKREYIEYFNLVMPKLKSGGFIIADNVLWSGKILEQNNKDPQTKALIEFNEFITRNDAVENMIWPIRDGWMVIRKK